jgi:hypothetical protein
MMRNLQDIGAEVNPGGDDRSLRLGLEVTGEQETQARNLGHHRDAGVVLRRAFACGG